MCMIALSASRACWPAVGPRLERGVRPRVRRLHQGCPCCLPHAHQSVARSAHAGATHAGSRLLTGPKHEERASGSRLRLPLQPTCDPAGRLRRASDCSELYPGREEPVVHWPRPAPEDPANANGHERLGRRGRRIADAARPREEEKAPSLRSRSEAHGTMRSRLLSRATNCKLGSLRGLTFEVRRGGRWDARPARPMICLAASRAWWPAVGPRLDRGVRPRWWPRALISTS